MKLVFRKVLVIALKIFLVSILAFFFQRSTHLIAGMKIPVILIGTGFFLIGYLFFGQKKKWNKYKHLFFAFMSLYFILIDTFLVSFRWFDITEWVVIGFSFYLGTFFQLNWKRGFSTVSLLILMFATNWFYVVPQFVVINKIEYPTSQSVTDAKLLSTDFNTSIHLNDLKGKVLLLDFWFRRCGYCYKGFKELDEIANKFKDNPNVIVMAVNSGTDNKKDFLAGTQEIRNLGYNFDVAIDTAQYFTEPIGATGYPTQMIVDKSGMIHSIHGGFPTDARTFRKNWIINAIEGLVIN